MPEHEHASASSATSFAVLQAAADRLALCHRLRRKFVVLLWAAALRLRNDSKIAGSRGVGVQLAAHLHFQ